MAKGSIMLQVDVLQEIAEPVTSIPSITVKVFDFLSFGKTIVREITAEKAGGIIAGAANFSVSDSATPFAILRLFLRGGEEVFFLAPSQVSSPQFEAGAAILEIEELGVTSIGSNELDLARHIGGHAYLDEVD
jgi:hypothetical protein